MNKRFFLKIIKWMMAIILVVQADGLFAGELLPSDSLKSEWSDSLRFGSVKAVEILSPGPAVVPGINWNRMRTAGLLVTVIGGGVSFYLHDQAEKHYRAYQVSGSKSDMQSHWNETEKLDKLSGWSYVVMEAGFLLTIYSFW